MTDFVAVLMDCQQGEVAAHVNSKLAELVMAVQNTTKGGALTLTLKLKPGKLAMGGLVQTVIAEFKCDIKAPELDHGDSIFFLTSEGALSRNDPRQEAMFTREEMNQRG